MKRQGVGRRSAGTDTGTLLLFEASTCQPPSLGKQPRGAPLHAPAGLPTRPCPLNLRRRAALTFSCRSSKAARIGLNRAAPSGCRAR